MALNKLYEEAIYKAKISILESEYYRLTAENEELRKQLTTQKPSEEPPVINSQNDLDAKKRAAAEAKFDDFLENKLESYKPALLRQKQFIIDRMIENDADFDYRSGYEITVKRRSVQFGVRFAVYVETGLTISRVMVDKKCIWTCLNAKYISTDKWDEFVEVCSYWVARLQKSPDHVSLFDDELVRRKLL